MTETAPARRGFLRRFWRRFRTPIVLLPLLAGLVLVAFQGAKQLWAEGPDPHAVPPEVTCWDDQTRPSGECGQPDGLPGLQWVFPSFQPDQDECTQVQLPPRKLARPLEYRCPAEFEGQQVTLTYSRRTSTEAGRKFVAKLYAGVTPSQVADGILAYRDPAVRKGDLYETTVIYTDVPFSVTVGAPDPELRDAAEDELVSYRDALSVSLGYAADQWTS